MRKLLIYSLAILSFAAIAKEQANLIDLGANDNFDQLIKDNRYIGVVVDFYATWCPPCKMLAPVIVQLAQEFPNILFIKVNTQSFGSLSKIYNVQSIPVVIFIKNGSVNNRIVGFQKPQIKMAVNQLNS